MALYDQLDNDVTNVTSDLLKSASRRTTSLQMLSFAVVLYTRVIPHGIFYRGSRLARNEEPFVNAASSGGSANVRAKWLKPDLWTRFVTIRTRLSVCHCVITVSEITMHF